MNKVLLAVAVLALTSCTKQAIEIDGVDTNKLANPSIAETNPFMGDAMLIVEWDAEYWYTVEGNNITNNNTSFIKIIEFQGDGFITSEISVVNSIWSYAYDAETGKLFMGMANAVPTHQLDYEWDGKFLYIDNFLTGYVNGEADTITTTFYRK